MSFRTIKSFHNQLYFGQEFEVFSKDQRQDQTITRQGNVRVYSTKDSKTVSAVDLEHLSQEVASEVESLIDNYKPERNLTSPVEMKILLTDELPVFQHPRR